MACHLVALTFIFTGLPCFVFGGNTLYTFPSRMSLDCYSRTLPPPSPSDDLRPPPSYRRRGVAVGCRSEKRKAGQDRSGKPVLCRVLVVERYSIYSLFLSLSSNYLHQQSSSPGWMSLERCSIPLPPPSPSDDLRPPPSYRCGGVAVGTRRLVTVNPDLAPSVRSGKRKVGQGGSGKPPPPAGQLLQVGSPWRKESSCTGAVHQMLLPALLRMKMLVQKRAPIVICRYDILFAMLHASDELKSCQICQWQARHFKHMLQCAGSVNPLPLASLCLLTRLPMIAHRRTLDGVLIGPCTVTGHLWGIEYLALDKLLKVTSGRVTLPLFTGYSEVLLTALRLGQLIDSLVPI
ncbi:hypothetical protein EDB84DRAFT_1446540 [Lactarius hengduanensis]|nr:hypothetical protein EDB84DRAFT_1446540 [Lactarius hengduanensis]